MLLTKNSPAATAIEHVDSATEAIRKAISDTDKALITCGAIPVPQITPEVRDEIDKNLKASLGNLCMVRELIGLAVKKAELSAYSPG